MKNIALYAGLLVSLLSHQVWAANAYLQVFLDDAPLRGVAVTLDGVSLGSTDATGGVSGSLVAGTHKVILSDDDLAFPISFDSAADEDVEISVVFTTTEGDEPLVEIQKFAPGDTSGTGYITGVVANTLDQPVEGASVVAVGAGMSATTDDQGVYLLEVPRGSYKLKVAAADYQDKEVTGLRILAGSGVTTSIKLRAADSGGETVQLPSTQIEEVVVLGVFKPTEDNTALERYATSITNAIDVAMLERFGDSDVAAALSRVVGVAVTDSKYANVRGLDGRYISSSLNGLLMPSTDPMRRDVQLDLFPTNILGGIEIQKSYTPDQMASTTGGSIKINTKGLPDERVFKVSASAGYNFDFTGDDVLSYRGSYSDWAGFDSGLRDIPWEVVEATDGGRSLTICDPAIDPVRCTSPQDAALLGVLFQDDYNVKSKQALPDGGVSVSYGDRIPLGDGEFGFYAAADYDHSTSDRGEAVLSNPLETEGIYQRARETTDLNGYLVFGYEYGAANEILSKTSILRSTDDTTRLEEGVDQLEGNGLSSAILEYVERQFFAQAITGHNEWEPEHGTHSLDWRVAYSRTDRDEPDRRQYTYFNGNLSTSAFERRWSDLNEDSTDFVLDYNFSFDWGDYNTTNIKIGGLLSEKEREVGLYRFGIRLGDLRDISLDIDQDLEKDVLPYWNFLVDRVRLAANTADTDSYESTEETAAYYLSANTDFGETWSLLFGARFEEFTQELNYPNDPTATNELEFDDWYPAVNLTWRPTEEWQFRVGYSETVSYPGLIERSESLSYDPETDDPIFGNPDLKVSTIENIDFRAEYYFSDEESVSIAYFTKEITNPIERALPDASGSAARGITFRNQDSADISGIELDGSINVLDEADYLLFVSGNVSYIESDVKLSEDSIRLEGADADGRQLQGQSEYLANLQIGFDHYPTEQKFTLLVNYFDDRIFRISRGSNLGPEYEVGRVLVDITYEKMFSENFTLELAIKNLLNDEVEYRQNGRTIESYQGGTSIGITLNYEFL